MGDAVTLTATNSVDSTITNGATASFTVDTVLSKTNLSFGPQTVGTTSATQSLVISNSASAALAISQIAASPEFSQTNNCTSSLASGSTCMVQVSFTPATYGSRSGNVVDSDSTMVSPRIVALAGTGIDFAIAPATASQTVTAGQTATYTINLTTQGGALTNAATFTCSGLPANSSCSFNPASIAAGSATDSTTMTITTTTHTLVAPRPAPLSPDQPALSQPVRMAMLLMIFTTIAAYLIGWSRNRKLKPQLFVLVFLAALAVLIISCGGGGSTATGTPAGTSSVTVTGASAATRTTTVSLVVN